MRKKDIEINDMQYSSSLIDECEQCRKKDFVFYNENGEALCEDCLVEFEYGEIDKELRAKHEDF